MSTPRSPRPIATEATVRTRAKRPRASRGERDAALLEAALIAEHALATDDDDLGGLLRMEPAQVDVRRDATLELEVARHHVGDAGLQVAVLVQPDGGDPPRHEVEEDRDVV